MTTNTVQRRTTTKRNHKMDGRIVGRALANAQRLMNNDSFNAAVDARRGTVTEDSYDAVPVTTENVRNQGYRSGVDPMDYTRLDESQINTNLPKEILEAMLNNPIDVSQVGGGTSVLDQLENYGELERKAPVRTSGVKRINEQTTPMSSSISPVGVDYNYIKYLINEAIKENLAEIKSALLSESTLAGLKVKQGGTVAFIDTKNNIFEAKLVLKKKGNEVK